jgi:diguanylate cyclase (GGDEF)-like protein
MAVPSENELGGQGHETGLLSITKLRGIKTSLAEFLTPPPAEVVVKALEPQQGKKMDAREFYTELFMSVCLAVAATLLYLADPPHSVQWLPVLGCCAVMLLAAGIRVDTVYGWTTPIQLVFVPMLFVAPLGIVVILVTVTEATSRVIAILRKQTTWPRMIHSLPSNWFAVGPVAVFVLAHVSPGNAGPGILVAALAAQLLVDTLGSWLRFVSEDATWREVLLQTWIYVVDIALSGVALIIAEEIRSNVLVLLALLPLLGLIQMFSRERRQRLDNLMELRVTQEKLVFRALHDPVTGLANRVALTDRLEQALKGCKRSHYRVALLFLDLDGFKEINDGCGHDVGDLTLIAVAERLQAQARAADTVARFGGDEFVILCTDLSPADDIPKIGGRFVETLQAPIQVNEHIFTVTASLGGVIANDPEIGPGAVVRQADSAMYEAKRSGRNRVCVFDTTETQTLETSNSHSSGDVSASAPAHRVAPVMREIVPKPHKPSRSPKRGHVERPSVVSEI